MSGADRRGPRFPGAAAAAAAVALLAFAAFLPALRGGWAWDDELNFLANARWRGLGWEQLRWMFTTAHLGPYQPLTWLSAALDHAWWGMSPFGYHLTNLLLHAANAVLVFLLAARLLPAAARGRSAALAPCAAAGALLFAAHPLRVEAVAWITERRTVLAGLFYFSALLAWLEAAADEARRRRLLAASAGLFLLSLLSKGLGAALPLTMLVLDVYPLRRLPADPRRWAEPASRAVLLEKLPFLLLAAAFGAVETLAYGRYWDGAAGPAPSWPARALQAGRDLVFYAVKTALPLRLSPRYEPAGRAALLAGAAAAAALTGLLWRLRRRCPAGLAAWAHHAAALAPVLGLIRYADHAAADRYTYLAGAGWALLAAAGLWSSARRRLFRPALAAAAGTILVLGLLSWRQTRVWRDSVSLWTHARRMSPDSPYARRQLGRSFYNLGNAFFSAGRPREAWRMYNAAIQADPDDPLAYNNLGLLLFRHGATQEAVERFRQALEREADNPGFVYNLGVALAKQGKLEESAASFCRAIRSGRAPEGAVDNLRAVLAAKPALKRGLHAECLRPVFEPRRSGPPVTTPE